MAKIIQVLDVDPKGLQVRLDDGRIVHVAHNGDAQIGAEFAEGVYEEAAAPCPGCAARDTRIAELSAEKAGEKEEVAWVIEYPNLSKDGRTPLYFGRTADGLGETPENMDALRFSRKQDAEDMILDLRADEAVAAEHIWG